MAPMPISLNLITSLQSFVSAAFLLLVVNTMVKRFEQQKKQEDKGREYTEPNITRVESFIDVNYDIRYNIVSLQYEMKQKHDVQWELLNENDIWRHLQKSHIDFPVGKIISLLKSNFTPKVNPISHFFENLPKWNGKTDHISKLCEYISVPNHDKERFIRMFKKMMVRCIASGFAIDFNKHAFILVGSGKHNQHTGKTWFWRWMLPQELEEYMCEDVKTDKDGLMSLAGNFWINLDELAGFAKQEINSIKSFMSRDKVKVRLPYDRSFTLIQRICNFVGSTNDAEFLKDPTGSVRWICFKLIGDSPINFNYSKELKVNDLWAQAYSLFMDGEAYQLTKEEINENEMANIEFFEKSIELELIMQHMEPCDEKSGDFLTSSEIKMYLDDVTRNSFNLNVVGIGKALSALGYQKSSDYKENLKYSIWGYHIKKLSKIK